MKIINDSLFGMLEYKCIWEGKVKINFWDELKEYELGIDGNENGIFENSQREAYIYLVKNSVEISNRVKKAVYDYYFTIHEYYCDNMDLPLLTQTDEIKNLVKVKEFGIKNYGLNDRIIVIICDCVWDEDAGVGIKIINEKIETIGWQADVL